MSKLPEYLRIPDRLNIVLTAFCVLLSFVLFRTAAGTSNPWVLGALTILFGALFLTNYSLFHDAGHGKLHSNPSINSLLGVITGTIFLMPFSMFKVTHWGHHLRNRTDLEIWDRYYPGDSLLKKHVTWYSYMIGIWYWMIPLGAAILAFGSDQMRESFMNKKHLNDMDVDEFRKMDYFRIRIEVLIYFAYFFSLHYLIGLSWSKLALFYGLAPIWWSTTNYVEHYLAPRDVLTGAFNLQAGRWFSWINLHRELDLNHHLYTRVSWYHLPRVSPKSEPERISYFRHYWRQWLGIQPGQEPGPAPFHSLEDDYTALERELS